MGHDDDRSELVRGTLDLLVLRVLAQGPLHGYAIASRIRARSGDVLHVEEGSLYPALHRLERRGAVDASWGRSESNRRARFYRLTPRGRRELRDEGAAWRRVSDAVARVLGPAPDPEPA